jgi:hypothetical protein
MKKPILIITLLLAAISLYGCFDKHNGDQTIDPFKGHNYIPKMQKKIYFSYLKGINKISETQYIILNNKINFSKMFTANEFQSKALLDSYVKKSIESTLNSIKKSPKTFSYTIKFIVDARKYDLKQKGFRVEGLHANELDSFIQYNDDYKDSPLYKGEFLYLDPLNITLYELRMARFYMPYLSSLQRSFENLDYEETKQYNISHKKDKFPIEVGAGETYISYIPDHGYVHVYDKDVTPITTAPLIIWNISPLFKDKYITGMNGAETVYIPMNEQKASKIIGKSKSLIRFFNSQIKITLNPSKDCFSIDKLYNPVSNKYKKIARDIGYDPEYNHTFFNGGSYQIVCSPHFSKTEIQNMITL